MKLHEYHEFLKPFVEYLNFMPELICYDENTINKDSIDSDKGITDILKGI
jgi:hypothetical protein